MNIRKNINNSLRTALLAIPLMGCGTALLLTGCQDDHFDIVSTQATGGNTIWQNIQSHPELSQFADILQNVHYSQTEDKTTNETYADIFNGDQMFTVWAPANGMFDYDYYKDLLASGDRDSIYKVENELIRNNMARYSNVISGNDSVKLRLFNDKVAWLNYDNKTIKGAQITEANIGSSNGVLHITDAPVAYQPNLYEFLATRAVLDSINTFIKSAQTTEFNEDASTPGPTVNGVATWVDSITYMSNWYTRSFMNTHLNREDSNYVMIVPTNNAWENILEKTKRYYKYKKGQYVQNIYDATTTQTRTERKVLAQGVSDSLQNLFAKNAICQNLAFNANWQYERIPITSLSSLQAADARLDSLRSTAGMKFKKTGTMNGTNSPMSTVEIDNYAAMFGNADPIEVSNGYAYVVDEYTYPHTIYAPNYDMSARSCFEVAAASVTATGPTTYHGNDYMVFRESNNTNANIWFKFQNVCSCKYDIYVVVGYNDTYEKQNRFTAAIIYNNETSSNVSTYTCRNPNEDAVDATGASLYNSTYFVNKVPEKDEEGLITNYMDTICIAKDFEFPVAYYGLGNVDGMENLFPQLRLNFGISSTLENYYLHEIRINAIILKSKEW
ncbi:MAG: hypothetical protein J1F40_07040 [Prevotellaceae bacterium]|nr:hypothetical protein [Prevotellaceae bacterium]